MATSNVVSTDASADVVVADGPATYYGFSLRETTGTGTATVRVWDSPDSTTTNDVLLDTIQLAAGESAREDYLPQGIRASKGIWVDVVSGTVEGVIRHG